jgi:hypothetical protein
MAVAVARTPTPRLSRSSRVSLAVALALAVAVLLAVLLAVAVAVSPAASIYSSLAVLLAVALAVLLAVARRKAASCSSSSDSSEKERAEVSSERAGVRADWGVAVAGWQWFQSIERSKAVILIPVRTWQWQYWQSCGDYSTNDAIFFGRMC